MTHEPMCPCNNADERGCFLISAETGKCISCVCGDKMGAYLDGYAAALDAAEAAVAELPLTGGWTTPDGVIEEIDKGKALAAINALRGES